jgi:hypothetical protein
MRTHHPPPRAIPAGAQRSRPRDASALAGSGRLLRQENALLGPVGGVGTARAGKR